jgi:hypothetical protein
MVTLCNARGDQYFQNHPRNLTLDLKYLDTEPLLTTFTPGVLKVLLSAEAAHEKRTKTPLRHGRLYGNRLNTI